MNAHNIAKKPAIPYRGFILYHGIEFSIIDHFTASDYKYAYYCNSQKGYFWHPQNLIVNVVAEREHIEAMSAKKSALKIGRWTIEEKASQSGIRYAYAYDCHDFDYIYSGHLTAAKP